MLPIADLPPESTPGRFHAAIALHNTGVAMMCQNLRRRHPQAGDAQIDGLLAEWLGHGGYDLRGDPLLASRSTHRAGDAA